MLHGAIGMLHGAIGMLHGARGWFIMLRKYIIALRKTFIAVRILFSIHRKRYSCILKPYRDHRNIFSYIVHSSFHVAQGCDITTFSFSVASGEEPEQSRICFCRRLI